MLAAHTKRMIAAAAAGVLPFIAAVVTSSSSYLRVQEWTRIVLSVVTGLMLLRTGLPVIG